MREPRGDATEELPRAWGAVPVPCIERETPDDFVVEEVLGFDPTGEGTHAWLKVRKREANTEWVARGLARHAGVRPVGVGYAGLKDRRAVAVQWFSVDLAGRPEPDWGALNLPGVEVLAVTRHARKLRRGQLRGNRFCIVLRELRGDLDGIGPALAAIRDGGVPNYFGPQRFGRGGANLGRARAMLEEGEWVRDRHRRGLYLSTARSFLFNRVLARRVDDGTWNRLVEGDVLVLDGSRSRFAAVPGDTALERRIREQDAHPSGPLWGRGESPVTGPARALESDALAGLEGWRAGLERAGLAQDRRATRARVVDLTWDLAGDRLSLGFALPAGSYATSVLREIAKPVPGDVSAGG